MSIVGTRPPLISETNLYEPRHKVALSCNQKLLDDMKFQWSRTPDEVKEISFQQVEWLLQGLEIEQKKAYHQVKINYENSCF